MKRYALWLTLLPGLLPAQAPLPSGAELAQSISSATLDTVALFAAATVVSRPAPDRVILDCGAKTLALDGARGFSDLPGHGLVCLPDGTPDPTLLIERLSEEHATVKTLAPTRLKVGDRVAYACRPPGAYAEARVMGAADLVKLPDGKPYLVKEGLLEKHPDLHVSNAISFGNESNDRSRHHEL